jgi:tRNA(Ile)-lysidine synthase
VNIVEVIRDCLADHALVPAGTNVIVGVSGGADSVALLHALHRLDLPVTIAHLNHQLRGAESDADELMVRKLAEQLDLPIITRSTDVAALAADSGLSTEMAARQARHDFFAEFDNSVIALGHHADDQVETFFLKLARGAGPDGLGGMPYAQRIGTLRLIRPMLDLPRADIIAWLQENGIAWREDASNRDESFLRNRVRHTVLPLLERELNPNIRETIRRTMNILREENTWMEQVQDGSETTAAKRRKLRKWLFEQGIEDVGFDAVEQILSLIDDGKGSTVYELNAAQRVVVEYGTPRFETDLQQPEIPKWILQIEKGTGWRKDLKPMIGKLPAQASFNANVVGDSPIEARGIQHGDRIQPLGMTGSRKLQDILTDLKVPRAQRTSIPVVVCRDEIIWVPGYRIARGWEVLGNDGKAFHVRIEQNP